MSRAGDFLQRFDELGLDSPHVYTTAFDRAGKLIIRGTYVHPKYPQIVHTVYHTPWTEQQAKQAGVYTGSEMQFHGNRATIKSVTSNKPLVIPIEGQPQTKVQEVPKPQSDYLDQVKWVNGAWRRHTPNGWVKDIVMPAAKVAGSALVGGLVHHGVNKLLKHESVDEAYTAKMVDGRLQFMSVRTDKDQPKKVYSIYQTDMDARTARTQGILANMQVEIHGDRAVARDPKTGKHITVPVLGKPRVVVKDIPKPTTDAEGAPMENDDLQWHNGEWASPSEIEPEDSWQDTLAEPLGVGAGAAVNGAVNHFVQSRFGQPLKPGARLAPPEEEEPADESLREDWVGISAVSLLRRYDESEGTK